MKRKSQSRRLFYKYPQETRSCIFATVAMFSSFNCLHGVTNNLPRTGVSKTRGRGLSFFKECCCRVRDCIQTIADKRADKTAEQHRAKAKQKLTRLQDTKNAKRRKPDANWVRNISSRPLDETETQVLSYGLKHSVTPKQIPTEAIVSSVEAVLSRQHELSESTKDNIR